MLDAGAVERVLDDLFSRGSFEHVVEDLLFPALERLGDAWASGEVSVAGEHLASHAVQRRLAPGIGGRRARSGVRRRGVVVGLPPGGRHELGALAFAVAARRAGIAVTYLGPDLPADDWVTAATSAESRGSGRRPDAAGSLKAASAAVATRRCDCLRRIRHLVVASGAAAGRQPSPPSEVLRLGRFAARCNSHVGRQPAARRAAGTRLAAP